MTAFDNDHTGGPVRGLPIKMHWKSGFLLNWNRQAIFVLVSDFLAEHASCTIMEDDLQVIFGRKLECTHQEWILVHKMQTEEVGGLRVEAAKKNRWRGFLHGVRLHMQVFC